MVEVGVRPEGKISTARFVKPVDINFARFFERTPLSSDGMDIIRQYKEQAQKRNIGEIMSGTWLRADGIGFKFNGQEDRVSTHVETAAITRRMEQVGRYHINNNILGFVKGDGELFLGRPTEENICALEEAGYKSNTNVSVPFSNGEVPMEQAIRLELAKICGIPDAASHPTVAVNLAVQLRQLASADARLTVKGRITDAGRDVARLLYNEKLSAVPANPQEVHLAVKQLRGDVNNYSKELRKDVANTYAKELKATGTSRRKMGKEAFKQAVRDRFVGDERAQEALAMRKLLASIDQRARMQEQQAIRDAITIEEIQAFRKQLIDEGKKPPKSDVLLRNSLAARKYKIRNADSAALPATEAAPLHQQEAINTIVAPESQEAEKDIRIGAATEARDGGVNEDTHFVEVVDGKHVIAGVFDGVGGGRDQGYGGIASQLAAKVVREKMLNGLTSRAWNTRSPDDIEAYQLEYFPAAERAILERKRTGEGIGKTTAAVVYATKRGKGYQLVCGGVGDSRVLVFDPETGILRQILKDKSRVAGIVDKNDRPLPGKENEYYKNRMIITDSLGSEHGHESRFDNLADYGDIKPGSIVMLVSDGVTDNRDRMNLESKFKQAVARGDSPEKMAKDMVSDSKAVARGGRGNDPRAHDDDMTAVVIFLP